MRRNHELGGRTSMFMRMETVVHFWQLTMDQNDKPFACSIPGCNQKFVTEDRLSCHMRKHELDFESITSSLFTDQTPTPTTFLRDCENLGLFQDLPLATKNPFDESFRKAVRDPDAHGVEGDGVDSPSIPILPDSASLLGVINTPGKDTPGLMRFRPVFLTPDVAKVHSQMSNDNLDTPSLDSTSASLPLMQRVSIDTPTVLTQKTLNLGLPSTPKSSKLASSTKQASTDTEDSKEKSSPCITPSSDGTASQLSPMTSEHTNSQQTAIDLTSPAVQPCNISTSTPSNSSQQAVHSTTVTVSTPAFPQFVAQAPTAPTSVQAGAGGQSLVMLHVNKSGEAYLVPANKVMNNKMLPVRLSTPLYNGSQSSLGSDNDIAADTGTTAPPSVFTDNSQSSLSMAKMKLKQALTKQHPFPAAPAYIQSTLSDSETSVRSRHSSTASGVQKRTYSRSDDELDENDKRMKSLQRNRDAARRCRKKKKFFMQNLEDKLKETTHLNTQLQTENAKLKLEIVELKSLFIAHKDCDVTKKQLAEGSLNSLLTRRDNATPMESEGQTGQLWGA